MSGNDVQMNTMEQLSLQLGNMSAMMQQMQQALDQQQHELQAQAQLLQQAQQVQAQAQPAPQVIQVPVQAPAQAPTSAAKALSKALQKPPTYDRKNRKEAQTFIAHLKHYINGNPETFLTDDAKITFAVSYLRDAAFKWVEPHLLKGSSPLLHDFQLFLDELLRNLGDPDRTRTLTKELQALKQVGSAAHYTSQFYQVSSFLGWNDEALRGQYYTGLKPEVKDALAYASEDPQTLKDLSDLAIKLDNRLYDRRMNKSGPNNRHQGPQQTREATLQAPQAPTSDPTPMDLDSTATLRKFKPLTDAEKRYRQENHLCLYCGNKGHKANQCPAKAQHSGR
jgi:hypothetical protein